MAEEQSSFNPILAGVQGEGTGDNFSQGNPFFDEKRLSKRGLMAKEGHDPEGEGAELVKGGAAKWLKDQDLIEGGTCMGLGWDSDEEEVEVDSPDEGRRLPRPRRQEHRQGAQGPAQEA